MNNIFEAKELRNKEVLKTIPNNKPGYYKWWAKQSDIILLLEGLEVSFDEVKQYIEYKNGYYCIYIGIAAKESIRNRLNWHINDRHTESRVKNGTLSTLRQSISSIISHNQYDKEYTNNFIDNLKVEYFTIEDEIKSVSAKEKLHSIEIESMSKYMYILNIMDNHFEYGQGIKNKLKALRKTSK